jgi:hypothetical protein
MKTIVDLLFITGCAGMVALSSTWAAEDAPSRTAAAGSTIPANVSFQTGVIEEEANLNPEAALAAYQAVIQQFDAQRVEAAQAIFRAGEVMRKAGNSAEARRNYERIVREFADQTVLARQSQQQLAIIRSNAKAFTGRLDTETSPWLLNVAFGSSLTKHGKAAIGHRTNDYWNGYYLPWIDVVPLVNLMLWNGTITPVSMEIRNAAGTWNNNTGDPMYDAYVYVNDGSDKHILITLTNLPPGRYDFYLYGHADPGGQGEGNSQFQIRTGGRTTDWAGTTRSAGWRVTEPWTEGKQFIRLSGIDVNPGDPVVVAARAGFDGQPVDPANRPPVINGMQIIKTDDIIDPGNASVVTPKPADPSAQALQLEHLELMSPGKTTQARQKSTRNLQLLDALRESQATLRTQLLTDLQRQMVQAQERMLQAQVQYDESCRVYQQIEKFTDRPELLPKPAANDPRYQKLKETVDQAMLAFLERPEDDKKTVDATQQLMRRFIKDIYAPELKAAFEEAAEALGEQKVLLDHLRDRLAKEQERLKADLALERSEQAAP